MSTPNWGSVLPNGVLLENSIHSCQCPCAEMPAKSPINPAISQIQPVMCGRRNSR
jgi:hypothetical protein